MWNIIKFIGYTFGGYVLRASYNWLTKDLDPEPGTKEFAREYRKTYAKYERLRRKDDAYRKNNRRSN